MMLCAAILFSFLSSTGISQPKKIVVIDPGHGGHDKGAIGHNGINEKDINLAVCLVIKELQKSFYPAYDFRLTRETDTYLTLSERAKMAASQGADLFVSIHCNQIRGDGTPHGSEVYVQQIKQGRSESNTKMAISLALDIENGLNQRLGFRSRDVRFANFQVLRETISEMPSVLVEMGFISNPDEARYFEKYHNVRAVAMVILEAINKNLGQ